MTLGTHEYKSSRVHEECALKSKESSNFIVYKTINERCTKYFATRGKQVMAMTVSCKDLTDTTTKIIVDEEAKAYLCHLLKLDQQNTFFLVEESFHPSEWLLPKKKYDVDLAKQCLVVVNFKIFTCHVHMRLLCVSMCTSVIGS